MIFHVTVHKKITNHETIFFSSILNNKITIRDILSWLDIRLIKALRNHAAPTVPEARYRGMADSASYADCEQRAAAQRTCLAWANEHVAASKPRILEKTQREERAKTF